MIKKLLFSLTFVAFAITTYVPMAEAAVEVGDGLKIYGDYRFRYEDAERTNSAGVAAERDRLRYRLRFGYTATLDDNWTLGGRITTNGGVNSPHETMGDGFARDGMGIDKAYVNYSGNGANVWLGKNTLPLWEQNEYFWDADINPEGLGITYSTDAGAVKVGLNLGYFVHTEAGWVTTGDDTMMTVYQIVVSGGSDAASGTFAYGVLTTDDEIAWGGDVCALSSGLQCEYTLISVQGKFNAGGAGITVGYDLMTSDASVNDEGTVIGVRVDVDKVKLVYRITEIEANGGPGMAGLSGDDYPSYQTDFDGTEIIVGYKIAGNRNVDLKLFDGEDNNTAVGTNNKDETLFQINYNSKF